MKRKKAATGGRGAPEGVEGGGPATAIPRLIQQSWQEGEAEGSAHRSPETAAGNPRPLCCPRGGAGNRVQRLVATCPWSHSKAGSRGTVNVHGAHPENPSSQHPGRSSRRKWEWGWAGLLCPAYRSPGAAAGEPEEEGQESAETRGPGKAQSRLAAPQTLEK